MSDSRRTANDDLAAMVASRRTPSQWEPDESDSELAWPCLLIRVGARWCGLRAESVSEVVVPDAVTKIPAQPEHVLGVSLVHGRLVPVINVGPLMPDMDAILSNPRGRRMAVVAHGESEIGLLADDAKGVIELPVPEYDPAAAARPAFIRGEVRWEEELVCLLDVPTLIQLSIGLV